MPIYVGKLNYANYASDENIIVDLPDGWVTHGRARVWSTWTKDASGVAKSLAFGPALGAYVLRDVNDDATKFAIRDLDNKNYYYFHGIRHGDSVTLSLLNPKNEIVKADIPLKLHE